MLAFNLSGWPVGAFSATVRAVSLPAFAVLQDDPLRHQASFGRALGLLFVPVVPACVLLGVLGGPLVRVVYGDRWSDAAAPLALLAVLGRRPASPSSSPTTSSCRQGGRRPRSGSTCSGWRRSSPS